MKRILAELFTVITAILALVNPYAVTPMMLGKIPIFIGFLAAGLWVAIWADWEEKT